MLSTVTDGFDFPVGKPDASGYRIEQAGGEYLDRVFSPPCNADVYHPGEDWNGLGGGDTDLGDDVFAVANGTVVSSGDYGQGWGNIVLIRHDLPSGAQVWSQYAHLQARLLSQGATVTRGQTIGTIGKGHNGEYLAHLHFEIRKIYLYPNAWVCGLSTQQVQARYENPSVFINGNRPNLSNVDLDPYTLNGPSTAQRGSTISVFTDIDNKGTSPSGSFTVRYYLSINTLITTSDILLKTVTRSSIAGGTYQQWFESVVLASSLTPGTYYVGVIVDPFNAIAETDESNNAQAAGSPIIITA